MARNADLLLDTSAAIPLVTASAALHDEVRRRVEGKRLGLAGHASYEMLSVLTRLPGALRLSPAAAARLIAVNFPATRFLDENAAATAVDTLARAGVGGGSVYDGLVGLAAASVGTLLLTGDRRAVPTYAALGVDFELVREPVSR